ncbi:MAG: TetR/AcrR family transcriptional regulator [Actinomyces succiniciruminis]|nr:TetR/AcrR family transcriptional regulator [Actinomyces succiniciruminis]
MCKLGGVTSKLQTASRTDLRTASSPQSRQRLVIAATALLDERDPAEITITDVVKRAGLTRPTFYASFPDLPGAFAAAAVARLEDVFAAAPPAAAARQADAEELAATFRQLLTRMQPHAEFFLRVLNGPGGPATEAAIIQYLAERLRSSSPATAALAAGPLPLQVSSEAIAAGVTWTMRRWLADPHAPGVEAASGLLRDLVLRMTTPGLGGRAADRGVSTDEGVNS